MVVLLGLMTVVFVVCYLPILVSGLSIHSKLNTSIMVLCELYSCISTIEWIEGHLCFVLCLRFLSMFIMYTHGIESISCSEADC